MLKPEAFGAIMNRFNVPIVRAFTVDRFQWSNS